MTPSPAIGCTRISTHGQRDGYGQLEQAQEITRYAQAHDLELLEIIPEVESGARELASRDAVQRYYQLAEQRPGLTFIFPRVDRIGRRAELILGIVRELHARQATVITLGLPMDLRSREGMLMLTTLAGMAEFDHSGLRDRMDAGRRQKAQAGRWPHGSPPWGYRLARDARGVATLPEIVEDQAAAVRRLFILAVEHGESALLRIMRAEGWPAPTAAGWRRKSVHNILANPMYGGRRVYQGITIEYPAIVEPELLARVQQAREERRTRAGREPVTPLLFTGHVRCVCGASMGRDIALTRSAVRTTYPIYRCWRAKTAKVDERAREPHAPQRSAERVDALLWAALTAHLTDPVALSEIVRPTMQATPLDQRRVDELEAAIARAYEPLTAGAVGYTLAIAQTLARPYADELARLRAEHAAQAAPAAVDGEQLAAQFVATLAQPMTFEEQRALLHALRVQMTLGPAGVEAVSIVVP